MPEGAVNHYKADLRAIQFTLYEHLHVEQLFAHEAFSHLSREECDATIEQCLRFVNEYTGPLNGPADRVGCVLEDGVVRTPAGFKEAWRKLYDLGFMSFAMPLDAGGFGGPHAIGVVLEELESGANTAFTMYQGLTHGAADVIEGLRAARAQATLPAADDGRTLLGDDVPLGAARRLRRRRDEDTCEARRRQRLRDHRHEVLDLGRRPRPHREHHPPRARTHRGGAGGHEGALALHRAEGLGERRRLAREAERRRHRVDRAQARHPRLGDGRPQLRRERRLPRHPRRPRAAHGDAADVPHDERRPHRGRRTGAVGRVDGVPERASPTHASGCKARRPRTSRTRMRRAFRSSSTPTSAACFSR